MTQIPTHSHLISSSAFWEPVPRLRFMTQARSRNNLQMNHFTNKSTINCLLQDTNNIATVIKKINPRQMLFTVKPDTLVASLLTFKQCHKVHEDFTMRTILTKLTCIWSETSLIFLQHLPTISTLTSCSTSLCFLTRTGQKLSNFL